MSNSPSRIPEELFDRLDHAREHRAAITSKTLEDVGLDARIKMMRRLACRAVTISAPADDVGTFEQVSLQLSSSLTEVIELYEQIFQNESQVYAPEEVFLHLHKLPRLLAEYSSETEVGTAHRELVAIATLCSTVKMVLTSRQNVILKNVDILEADRFRAAFTDFHSLAIALNAFIQSCNAIGGRVPPPTKMVQSPEERTPLHEAAQFLFVAATQNKDYCNPLVAAYERLFPAKSDRFPVLHEAFEFLSVSMRSLIDQGGNLTLLAVQIRRVMESVIRPVLTDLSATDEAFSGTDDRPSELLLNLERFESAIDLFLAEVRRTPFTDSSLR